MIKDIILNFSVFPRPIGSEGVAIVDARDIAEVAAIELIRHQQAPGKLAAIWSEALGRPVRPE